MSCTSMFRFTFVLALAACTFIPVAYSSAKDVVFVEDFTTNSANWANYNSSAFLTYSATGGPDGGSYASGPRNFNNLFPGMTTIMLRARHDEPFNSSGDAFKRNWLEDDITDVNLWVRHDFTAPLTYIMRVASESNGNGHVYQADGLPVQPNTWTQINFNVANGSPSLLSNEGSTYSQAYSNVGFVTFGVFVPSGLPTNVNGSINNDVTYNFDIDKVAILSPEPTAAALVGISLLGLAFGSRRRRAKLIG